MNIFSTNNFSQRVFVIYFHYLFSLLIWDRLMHSGNVRGQIWTFLKLKLEVRWVLNNWGKTEAKWPFFTEFKSIEIWLSYKQKCDFPNSKIFAEMLKNLAAHPSHCAVSSIRREMRFSVFTNILYVIRSHLRYRSDKSSGYFFKNKIKCSPTINQPGWVRVSAKNIFMIFEKNI